MLNDAAFDEAYKSYKNESAKILEMLVSHSNYEQEIESAKYTVYRISLGIYMNSLYYFTEKEKSSINNSVFSKAYDQYILNYSNDDLSHENNRRNGLKNLIINYLSLLDSTLLTLK